MKQLNLIQIMLTPFKAHRDVADVTGRLHRDRREGQGEVGGEN